MEKLERTTVCRDDKDIPNGKLPGLSASSSCVDSYMVTGHFQHDVTGICQAMGVIVIPKVVIRSLQGKRLNLDRFHPAEKGKEDRDSEIPKKKGKKGRGKKMSKTLAPSVSFTSSLMIQNRFTVSISAASVLDSRQGHSAMFDYFEPSIQVDLEDSDDDRSVNTIRIRGWQLDEDLWYVMRLCWPALERFSTLHLWRTGLDSDALTVLCSILPLCRQLTTVVLDNNNLDTDALSGLLAPKSILQHLSLCFCSITDSSVVHLAEALGSPTSVNASLLTLRLTGNQIGDQGAGALADALKLNNSLLVLTLTGNCIGNQGTQRLAQALSFFPLTDEWSRVRKEMVWASFDEHQEDWRQARRNEFLKSLMPKARKEKHRKEDASHDPSYVDSSNTFKGTSLSGKFSGPDWGNPVVRKHSKHHGKPTKRSSIPPGQKLNRKSINQGSKQDATAKVKLRTKSEERKAKEKEQTKAPTKSLSIELVQNTIPPPWFTTTPTWFQSGDLTVPALGAHPLLRTAVLRGSCIWLPGNRSLISLNLSRNQVGEAGATALLTSMQLQEEDDKGRLLRLELHKNPVSPDCPAIMRLKALMNKRDPLNKVIVEEGRLDESGDYKIGEETASLLKFGQERLGDAEETGSTQQGKL